MSELRTEQFDTPAPIAIRVNQAAGDLEVRGEPTSTTTVEVRGQNGSGDALIEKVRVQFSGDALLVDVPDRGVGGLLRHPKVTITVVAPEGSSLNADLAATDLTCRGALGNVRAKSAAGDIQIGDITGDVTAQSASGDIAIGRVGGSASVRSMSGDVALGGAAGEIDAHTASGDIAIGDASASVRARSASGDVAIASTRRGTVEVNTASGDVTVGVATGVGVWLDVSTMSGSTDTDLAVGDQQPASGCDLRLSARTMSGDVRIHRAFTQYTTTAEDVQS